LPVLLLRKQPFTGWKKRLVGAPLTGQVEAFARRPQVLKDKGSGRDRKNGQGKNS
jgi:hypothetical protein